MNYQDITHRLNTIFDLSTLDRITIIYSNKGKIIITIDLHKLSCTEAKRLLNNVIANVRIESRIDVIHGYRHGTRIKDMIHTHYSCSRIQALYVDPDNLGLTHINIL